MTNFDDEAFLDWLDDQDGPVKVVDLQDEFPEFPMVELGGCTGPMVDGTYAYYQHDLRTIAEGRNILD